ncbi:hypothetical protein H8S90_16055 [Olivibacter sp. SDN3]|uniref:hypothetical protein n=1 Tax=Olivibacter sp. SDN3 TaxID=2764720 RepID=UPI001650F115|nr:hypothetical protein [Olivibacter sp. SDN3]QNL48302.1 hypothetical protein H8S90_16055 [Olivibacter sp. SDN3]
MLEDRSLQSHSKARLWAKKYLRSEASREDFFEQTPWGLAFTTEGLWGNLPTKRPKEIRLLLIAKTYQVGLDWKEIRLAKNRWKLGLGMDRLGK